MTVQSCETLQPHSSVCAFTQMMADQESTISKQIVINPQNKMEFENIRLRSMPRENLFSPLSYNKHPSCSQLAASPSMTKRAAGAENPLVEPQTPPPQKESSVPTKAKSNASSLNVHHGWNENTPPTEPRRVLRCYHNLESTAEREWPKTGIRHVDPVEHTPRQKGLRVCHESRNHRQQACIVGVTDPVVSTPRTGVRCTRGYEGGAMSSLLSIDREPVAAKTTKKDFSLALEQRFVVTISDHAQRRHGGLSNFYVALSRSTIANPALTEEDLRVQDPLLFRSALSDQRPILTLGKCREQLCALVHMPLTPLAFAQLFWNMEGCEDVDDATLEALPVPFHDFARVFANAPQSQLTSKYKI